MIGVQRLAAALLELRMPLTMRLCGVHDLLLAPLFQREQERGDWGVGRGGGVRGIYPSQIAGFHAWRVGSAPWSTPGL